MKIAVVDGQGGGIGKLLIEKFRAAFGNAFTIIALGTNPLATNAMLKAGANEGASGENAIIWNSDRVDYIFGSVSIIAAHSFLGELSPRMAETIAASKATKFLIPMNRSGIVICGTSNNSLPLQIDHLIDCFRESLADTRHC